MSESNVSRSTVDENTREVEPIVEAHWSDTSICVQDDLGDFQIGYVCSRCHHLLNKTPRCGYCGAHMGGSEKDYVLIKLTPDSSTLK